MGPAKKRKRTAQKDESNTKNDDKDAKLQLGDVKTELHYLSEVVGAFNEMTVKSNLGNVTRKAHATEYGMPNSRWLKFPWLNMVISTTVLPRADRSPSRLTVLVIPESTSKCFGES